MTNTPATASAGSPLVDLPALVAAVRRRRRLWGALALLGLLLGAASAVLLPPPPSARTKVLVAHKEDQPNDTGTLIQTDVQLLQTTRVAGQALKALKSPQDPEDFMPDYRGTGLSNNLLQIDVTGDTSAEAVDRAEALADAFIADHVRRIREAANADATAQLKQRDRLQKELDAVNESIDGRSPQSDPNASADLESLFSRRAELSSQISDFNQRAEEARIGTPQIIAGTQIVDAPRAVHRSRLKAGATDAGIGLVLGLALGLALSAVGAVVRDRPVLRREIAANLGASVIAELRRAPRLWPHRRNRLARERLTATLARTVRDTAEPVSLLELGCARSTSEIAIDLARSLAAQQQPVVIVDGLPGLELAGRQPQPGDPAVVTGEQAGAVSPQDRRLGVGSVAPGTAWTDLQYLGTRTVLVVRAGHGSTAWLHTVARQLADQHIPVLGVVLIDPDPRDRTDGTLWDGVHTALRARSERLSRMNGISRPERELLPSWAKRGPDGDQEER